MNTATSLADVLPPEALAAGEGGALAHVAEAAEAVVHPRSTEEVAETVTWAAANDVGVLVVGSAERARPVPREGRFIVLTTDRLAGLEIYEPADVTLTAKAGTRFDDVEAALGAHRQWLPFDPPHVSSRTLGGLVATGESGPVGTGYGELRNHVLGATVVCGDGRTLRLGGRVVKNVAGFDLLRPVVGSRGRLGVITSVCLRAFPVPAEDRLLVHRADALGDLAEVARAVRTAPILPLSSVVAAPASGADGRAALLVRLQGATRTVDADQATLERHAGVAFERPDESARWVAGARDGATAVAVAVRLSLLPAKLFEGLAAVRRRLGDAPVVADAYAGSARVAVADARADELLALVADIESLGGTLVVDAPASRPDLAGIGSRPVDAELELTAELEQAFDPSGVFWPCRP